MNELASTGSLFRVQTPLVISRQSTPASVSRGDWPVSSTNYNSTHTGPSLD